MKNGFLNKTVIIKAPTENISAFSVSKGFFSEIWGDVYPCVPILSCLEFEVYFEINPKSPILITNPSETKMFSGLISKWDYPISLRYFKPCRICLHISFEVFSVNSPLLNRYANKSPCLQYSCLIYGLYFLPTVSVNTPSMLLDNVLVIFTWFRKFKLDSAL